MIATQIEIESLVSDLLKVLDTDIEHMHQVTNVLIEMRDLVINRQEKDLGLLLEDIKVGADRYTGNEAKRQLIRNELAALMGCTQQELTLSRLEIICHGQQKVELSEKKSRLQTLANQLKKEHVCTTLLLSDCVRFNRMLLKGIFENGKCGTTIYNSKGSTSKQTNGSFMNINF